MLKVMEMKSERYGTIGGSGGGGGGVGNNSNSNSGNKVVATLRADGSVRPAEGFVGKLATLMNYKIRTEAEVGAKSLTAISGMATVVDLGKQLLQYARDSDVKGVKNMMSRGAPFTSDWLGMSALHFAAMNNQYEICECLLRGGINRDSKTKVDRTPLHLACYYGNDRIVELLLTKRCAVNSRDMLRMTPLHWAVAKHHKGIVRLLLKHNADVTLMSKFRKTPIALAVLTEQADLLEELEAAKQAQANRKLNAEQEKETSDAVNSIIGLKNEIIYEPESIRKTDMASEDDELTNASDFADAKMADLNSLKEATGVLDKNAINLLKSHGITMIQDDEEDTSKDLLATALQNGRQLVLTEGGKMLLNETKRTQIISSNNNNNNNNNNNINSSNRNNNNSSHHNNNNNNNNSNNNNTIVPLRLKSNEMIVPQFNKIRNNVISKAKDNTNLGRSKNIRIISLNDFKRLYGNTNLKAIQKLPASLANSRLVRQLTDEDHKQVTGRKTYISAVDSVSTRQTKIATIEKKSESINAATFKDDVETMMDIIEIEPTDSEAETTAETKQYILSESVATPVHVATAKQPTEVIYQRATAVTRQSNSNAPGKMPIKYEAKQPTVIPLLGVPEICRQLYELRKQNEDLRRKYEVAQKEKDELRTRLERLEELLLVEKTDDDYTDS